MAQTTESINAMNTRYISN